MAQNPSRRTFEDSEAKRTAIPLLVGLTGASSSGKTNSALRLAAGIQRVVGGDIYGIDTEANRMKHYAEWFKFRHVPFTPPFGPADYLAAVEHCVSRGAKTIIVDSTSHLHEGPGGVLEMHEDDLRAFGGKDSDNFRAWARPKMELRRFINAILQMNVNFIFCFRAKDKIKIEKGTKGATHLGFMPIASEEFIYEMALNVLLYPGSCGVPTWQSQAVGERSIIKLPKQFRNLFGANAPLDEDVGQKLAEWAAGGEAAKGDAALTKDRDAWIEFWDRKGVSAERVMASLGKASVEDFDRRDLVTLRATLESLKQKRTTVAEAFPVSQAPTDADDFTAEDGKAATESAGAPAATAERGDEPSPEEWAAIEAAEAAAKPENGPSQNRRIGRR